MAIIWCGAEDVDFPAGAAAQVISTGANFRSAYARCAVYSISSAIVRSNAFVGGPLTSAWLSFRWNLSAAITGNSPIHAIGLGLSGTGKGLYLGPASGTPYQMALSKWDGTTYTQLALEPGSTISAGTMRKVDMQVLNYGTGATVNVYVDGGLMISYSGDVTVSGMTNFDCVILAGTNASSWLMYMSEIIVANEDTRGFPGLMTMALTAAGTTDQWTGLYSTINAVALSDTTPNYTNTVAQDQQFNVTDLAGGNFSIKAVKIAARSAASVGSTPTKVSLGYNNGGTVAVGTAQTLTNAYATYEQLDAVNPTTSLPFQQAEMNALQLDVRSS